MSRIVHWFVFAVLVFAGLGCATPHFIHMVKEGHVQHRYCSRPEDLPALKAEYLSRPSQDVLKCIVMIRDQGTAHSWNNCDEEVQAALLEIAQKKPADKAVLEELNTYGAEQVQNFFTPLLQDRDPEMRKAAIKYFGAWGYRKILPLLKDADVGVRVEALTALGGNSVFGHPYSEDVRELMCQSLNSESLLSERMLMLGLLIEKWHGAGVCVPPAVATFMSGAGRWDAVFENSYGLYFNTWTFLAEHEYQVPSRRDRKTRGWSPSPSCPGCCCS